MNYRVLVIEDEAVAAAAHASYVERLPGFELAGVARSGLEACRLITAILPVDLILLDMRLPDAYGLDLLPTLRQAAPMVDVIAVTGVRDLEVVRRAMSSGVGQYLLKPFTFAGFRSKLEQFAAYRSTVELAGEEVVQAEVDQLFGALRTTEAQPLPKGLSADTLQKVTDRLRSDGIALSASEIAQDLGISRVTARRYLEHLTGQRLVTRSSRYGSSGRPEVQYSWAGRTRS